MKMKKSAIDINKSQDEIPNLQLKSMGEEYLEIEEEIGWDIPNLKLEYLVPDFIQLKDYNPKQLSFDLKGKNTAA